MDNIINKTKNQDISNSNTTYKKEKGQFFTTDETLKKYVFEFIQNKPNIILEPSIGRGDLILHILDKMSNIKFDMYEIDANIKLLENIDKEKIIYGDFLKQKLNKKYDTIIGNPPYVKTNKGNLYISFIEKCYKLLKKNGELIFIIPSNFFKLTSSVKLLNEMLEKGTFTHIFHPQREDLFENASIDVIIFRYCKDKNLTNEVQYNNSIKYLINSNGTITFSDNNHNNTKCISDYFDIYVGIVSGKDEVYKNKEFGNIQVLNGKDKKEDFIYINEFPTDNEELNNYLLENKDKLMERRIKKFNENNWFEWGAPRNIKTIKNNLNKECIYIYNLTRNKEVAFLEKVQYFGGSLLMLLPKDNKKLYLQEFIDMFNNDNFKNNYMYSGRFKIGHRQLCNHLFDT
tara:strand:- start:847 stop:2049 length:1203 start_codon:yes stop_codon:yes gene_type:complete